MKFRKLISVLAASTMIASLITVNVNAAVGFDYDEGYYITNVMDVSQRTPYIETTVTQLTSSEVVALNGGTSGLSNKKLKDTAGSFGDTATWTVYRIDGTFKDVGDLGIGYDSNDNLTAYIKIKALDATMDFSSVAELGAQNTNWYVTADTSQEASLGTAWALQSFGNNRGVALSLDTPYPAGMAETAEGALINQDYSFRMYLVVPAGTTKTISYSSASAGVQYWVGNAVEGKTNQAVENKVASRSSSFTIQESAPAPTTYTYTFKNADGTADISVLSGLAAGATVTAPTAPTVADKKFDHWSDAIGGAAVVVDTTASADKTYYAVYVDDFETIAPDTTEQAAKVVVPGATEYTDYSGKAVTLTKNYAIARFTTSSIDGSKKYQIHATASTGTRDFDVNFGLIEAVGSANFVAIIKGAPTDTVMELRVK